VTTGHRMVNPDTLAPPVGFTHAVVAAGGTTVALAGQIGCGPDGAVVAGGLVPQFEQALHNVVLALDAAGGVAGDLVAVQIFVTDVAAYRASLAELGAAWRRTIGRHYPAAALLGVTGLFDAAAVVEVVATAVLPAAREAEAG